MPIDYSKWKNIEISDDEDDTHPNIDTPSLFRWRHKARLERMAEIQQEKEQVEGGKNLVLTRIQQIEQQLKDAKLDEKERMKLELERDDIQKQEEEFKRKEKELSDKERLQPWNVDTIGKEAWSKTIINKPDEQKKKLEASKPKKLDEAEEHKRTLKYFDENETLLQRMSQLKGFTKLEEFMLEHPQLASEYATNWMTIEALNYAIEEDEEKMDRLAHNCIVIQYLLELAKSLNALATNTNVIKNFFKKITAAEHMYMKMYQEEVESFKERLRKRAKDKREAAIDELEVQEKAKRIAASPGGVDPLEVLESLPEELRSAFESQSMEKMYEVAEKLDSEVFQYHLQRCIDSGLWIPNAKEHEEKMKQAKNKKKNEAAGAGPSAEEDDEDVYEEIKQ